MDQHTYKMGVIGNCAFMAHIDDTANVKWLCWPGFDSSPLFGSLLDEENGGSFQVRPSEGGFKTKQSYTENTNILCTEFEATDGKFRVTDFAPRFAKFDRFYKPLMLIRKIEPLSGKPKLRVSCNPKGNYGKDAPEVQLGSNHIRYSGFTNQLRLTTDISLNYVIDEREFVLNEPKYLVLTWGPPLEAPLVSTTEEFLRQTTTYWRKWILQASIGSFHQASVIRSALTIKLHQYDDTGAIIASGTTSLPESPNSGRNWDYRYCWLRDAYYTLASLSHLGHFEELDRYAAYIQNIAISTKEDRYHPIYSIRGDSELTEKELPMPGYLGNTPVRIGNQASTHVQNDVYGQILVSLLPLYIDHRFPERERFTSIALVEQLLNGIENTMDEPDAGLWEFRNKTQKHCYTFLFHWAGSSSALKIAQALKNSAMAERAAKLKALAAEQIEKCYNSEMGAYVQSMGNSHLDASLLQLITLNYLNPRSEKAAKHLTCLEKALKTDEGLFYRYKHEDDFGKPEVTFLVCAYWYVEALACVGRIEEAIRSFENLSKYSNHLGLMSEDIDPTSGSQWGNFPQTYSHVGLINAAHRITRKIDCPDFL